MRTLILSGSDVMFEGEVCLAILPGLDGEFSVMDFHQPFLYRLRPGLMKIKEHDEEEEGLFFPVDDGIARFGGNTLLIMCEKE